MSKASGIGLVIVSVITAAPSQTPPAPYWILELKFAILNSAPSGVLNTPFPHSHKCFCCPNQNFPEEEGRCLPFKLSAWLIQQLPKSGQGKYVAKKALAPSALSQSLRWETARTRHLVIQSYKSGNKTGTSSKASCLRDLGRGNLPLCNVESINNLAAQGRSVSCLSWPLC